MYPLQFRIINKNGFDVLHIAGNPVSLTAYPTEHSQYYATPKEKQFYCIAKERLLIFETTGYTPFIDPFHLQGLYAAIKWYGRTKLQIPNMEIRLTDPRRANKNKFSE